MTDKFPDSIRRFDHFVADNESKVNDRIFVFWHRCPDEILNDFCGGTLTV